MRGYPPRLVSLLFSRTVVTAMPKVSGIVSMPSNSLPYNRIVVSVPKRCFKRAVKRNLLKRRIREAYRLNKQLLLVSMPDGGTDILFIYSTKEVLDFSAVQEAVTSSLTAVAARLAARSAAAESNVVEIPE